MGITHDAGLLLMAGSAVVGLVVLIAWCRLPAFIALILASLFIGFCAGRNPLGITRSFAEGVGSVLGSIAMIIALGAILGKALAVSGGAEQIGKALIAAFGERWTHWAIASAAFLVGIPVFFGVGLVLLVPLVVTVARQRRAPLVRYGLPLVAGLSVAHGLVPPHPGPISAVGVLHADLGKTIFYSLAVGLPSSLICGAVLAPLLARNHKLEPAEAVTQLSDDAVDSLASGFGIALLTISLPVLLMLTGLVADLVLSPTSALRTGADWLGSPLEAMLIGALFSLWSLARNHGFDTRRLSKLSEECLGPVATVLLVVGAGGGFSRVLIDTGVGEAVARRAAASGISPLLLGWLIAALIRVATGSATVAITTASGFLAPITSSNPNLNREWIIVAMGAGSLMLSHVNDGGFWLVKEYLNLTVTETLRTWTVLETAISLLAFVLVLLLSRLF